MKYIEDGSPFYFIQNVSELKVICTKFHIIEWVNTVLTTESQTGGCLVGPAKGHEIFFLDASMTHPHNMN
jgi:hypothetical protein